MSLNWTKGTCLDPRGKAIRYWRSDPVSGVTITIHEETYPQKEITAVGPSPHWKVVTVYVFAREDVEGKKKGIEAISKTLDEAKTRAEEHVLTLTEN